MGAVLVRWKASCVTQRRPAAADEQRGATGKALSSDRKQKPAAYNRLLLNRANSESAPLASPPSRTIPTQRISQCPRRLRQAVERAEQLIPVAPL